jgi:arylsulfatase
VGRLSACIALAIAVAGCAREDTGPRDVVLITIDTLRADRVGLYGCVQPTTPFIDSLAAESVVFDRAYTTCPSTAPAVASLLTGTHRETHGVRANGMSLPDGVPTLAERLRDHGYRTIGRVANPLVDASRGFSRGFTDFAMPPGLSQRPPAILDGAPLVADVLHVLDGLGDEPVFLWVHFYDPHGPYFPPGPYRARFRAADYAWPDEPATLPVAGERNALFTIPQYQIVDEGRAPAEYRARYDAEIRYVDDHVRAIVERLRARGRWRRTVFVLTADHGEGLGERGYYFQHGWFANEAATRVPLLIRAPGLAGGRRVARLASLVDVVPTVLELAGLPPDAALEGRSLRDADAPDDARAVVAQSYHGTGEIALRAGRFAYVFTPARAANAPVPAPEDEPILPAAAHAELYDVDADPGEAHDLAATRPDVARDLRERVQAWLADQHRRGTAVAAAAKPVALDPLVESQLRALGYVN